VVWAGKVIVLQQPSVNPLSWGILAFHRRR
jgi:hypothetical protein